MSIRIQALHYSIDCSYYFEKLRQMHLPVLLNSDTARQEKNNAISDKTAFEKKRWDILSAAPVKHIEYNNDSPSTLHQSLNDVADAIERYTSITDNRQFPFISGAIGLISYMGGEALNNIQNPPKTTLWPLLHTGIYQWALLQDHDEKKSWLVADEKILESKWSALQRLFHDDFVSNKTSNKEKNSVEPRTKSTIKNKQIRFKLCTQWQSSLSRKQYGDCFKQIQKYILQGDCYQVNLTQMFFANYQGDPWQAYHQLSQAAPAPMSAYLETSQTAIISCSPEQFLSVHKGSVTTRPIKGTRPKVNSSEKDKALIKSLKHSEKDQAENLMIVDLMRNDLGKLCKTGSINVPSLFNIESFSNVHHLVSSITGEIDKNSPRSSLALLTGCMPGGSITGAPKIRAMEIINELEPHQREIYCGSLFYINNNGDMDSNILIRSLLFISNNKDCNSSEKHSGKVFCWGGGGIVADSNESEEFKESCYKVENLLSSLSYK